MQYAGWTLQICADLVVPSLYSRYVHIYILSSQSHAFRCTSYVIAIAIFCFPLHWWSMNMTRRMILLKRDREVEKHFKSFHAGALVYVKRHPHAFQLNLGFSPLRNVAIEIYNLRTKYFDSQHQSMTACPKWMHALKRLSRVGRLFNHFIVNFPLLDRYFEKLLVFEPKFYCFPLQ